MFRFRRKKKTIDPVVIVQRFLDAANRHDALGIAECLHPDFDSMQPIYPSRNFRGSDQVRRNWQAIFQSEPGFRLSLLRSAAADATVWVELHGAGKEVEVAGVFIMGVENNLVRWARVYSSVVDQEFQGPVETGAGPTEAVQDDDGVHDARVAAELREMIDAGRQTALAGEATSSPPEPAVIRDDDTVLWGPPARDDDLSTGEVPQVVVDEWAAVDDRLDAEAAFIGEEEPVEVEAVVDIEPEADADIAPAEAEDESTAESVAFDEEPAEVEPVEPLVAALDEEPAEVEPLVAADEPVTVDEEPVPDPVPAGALANLLETPPPPPSREPVIELVRPAADVPAAEVPDHHPSPPPPPATPADQDEPEGAVLELKPERRFRRLPRPSGRRS